MAQAAVAALKDGQVLLLENTRFHKGEEENDPAMAKEIAALGDIFVNDAFSAAHRAHASTEGVARLLPNAAGRSMQAELTHLEKALGNPARPLLAVVGGAKVSTKIALLENLVKRVEALVIGGAMANTFFAAQGIAVGKSLYEPDHLETARKVVHMATESGCGHPAAYRCGGGQGIQSGRGPPHRRGLGHRRQRDGAGCRPATSPHSRSG